MVVLERIRQIISHISLREGDRTHTEPYPGLSCHVGRTDKPLKHITLGQLLREQVELNGDSEALVSAWQGIRWTYRELDRRSDELARGFWALGVRKGDRIAIMAGNCGEHVLVHNPLQRSGLMAL
jgi:fatty-acyl-CoA synthase